MALGMVRYFDPERGFGYITPDDGGSALWVQRDEITDSPVDGALVIGFRVEYEEVDGKRGRMARQVSVVEGVIDDDDDSEVHEVHEEHEHAMAGSAPEGAQE